MLKFYNSNIYLDLELTKDSKGIILDCDFLPKKEIKNFFPNLTIIKKLDIKWLTSTETNVFLTYNQYVYFIYNWYLKTGINLEYDKNFLEINSIYKWIKEYFNLIIQRCDNLSNYAYEDILFPNYLKDFLPIFNERFKEEDLKREIKNIDFSNVDYLTPDISWAMYDLFIYKSPLCQEQVNSYLDKVAWNNKEEEKRLNWLFPVNTKYTKYYSPYPRTTIRSNWNFIKEIIDKKG